MAATFTASVQDRSPTRSQEMRSLVFMPFGIELGVRSACQRSRVHRSLKGREGGPMSPSCEPGNGPPRRVVWSGFRSHNTNCVILAPGRRSPCRSCRSHLGATVRKDWRRQRRIYRALRPDVRANSKPQYLRSMPQPRNADRPSRQKAKASFALAIFAAARARRRHSKASRCLLHRGDRRRRPDRSGCPRRLLRWR